jgi:Stress responsive A/B Barrel Domain
MFVSLRMITLPPDREAERDAIVEGLVAAGVALPGVRQAWAAPVSPKAVINAGHLVWRLGFASEREALAAPLQAVWRNRIAPLLEGAQVTGVGYQATRGAVRRPGPGVWRALVFRVMPQGFPDAAKAIEDGLLLFPKYIGAIRSWGLNQVATVEGPKAFTHVWEQEFDSLEGLTGEYMNHPIHWGAVDGWFDADCPQYVVDPHLIQVVAAIDEGLLRTSDG